MQNITDWHLGIFIAVVVSIVAVLLVDCGYCSTSSVMVTPAQIGTDDTQNVN